jgi:hypothetical protein
MNQIVKSFLDTHVKEYGIESLKTEIAFEHFCNRLIVNKYVIERFAPEDVMTDDGEIGLDGIAIIINDMLVIDDDTLNDALKSSTKLAIRFVFIQAKTSDKFDGDEIGTFCFGVKSFFLPKETRPKTNDKIERLIRLKDIIYTKSVDFSEMPRLDLFYICCGKWNEETSLSDRVKIECNYFKGSQNFGTVNFYPYDNEKIIITFKELKKKISKMVLMEKKFTFSTMPSIKQAYGGLIKCKGFINILQDNEGNMLRNIFEDNVRDFQGYNPVNTEIKNTIVNISERKWFSVLNNGLTIIAKRIDPVGDEIEIFDYQIVNGCQTSYVLFNNKEKLTDEMYLFVKIIEVEDQNVLDRLIYTTNRQTEVKSEAFASTKPFHKRLEDFYNSIEPKSRLYYERRSKQYDLVDSVNKNKVITLSSQIYSYISMFLNAPHSTHRYYGEVLHAYDKQLFSEGSLYEPYYISAYFFYFVNLSIRSGKISKPKYQHFKYHLICAMRALAVGKEILHPSSHTLRKQCNYLMNMLRSETELDNLLSIATTCLDEAILTSSNTPSENMHRSKELTQILLDIVSGYSIAKNSTSYLKKGDVVSCVVKNIDDYYFLVDIKADDTRNNGSVHISRIADRYIRNIRDEVSLSQIIQAKIVNDDYYEKWYGWQLSMMLDMD